MEGISLAASTWNRFARVAPAIGACSWKRNRSQVRADRAQCQRGLRADGRAGPGCHGWSAREVPARSPAGKCEWLAWRRYGPCRSPGWWCAVAPQVAARTVGTMGAIRPYQSFARNAFPKQQETPVANDENESD